ncbi:MAG: hypothetical protein M0Z71_06775 [Nitrospiraceae bacterium]|nr:hypothetical protein [Nitrospiraceae bacterium]
MRTIAILVMVAFFPVVGNFVPGECTLFCRVACAQETWKAEFDDICAKTVDSMNLSDEELKTLIARTDKLRPSIDNLEERQRKVYQRRLKQCRELFIFVLESRKKQ